MDWIHLAKDWDLRLALMNVVMNFGFEVCTAVAMKYMILCGVMLQNICHHSPQDTLFTMLRLLKMLGIC
jgi:hypothetical protein